jgi:phosphatidate cytidylyltransferase
LASPLSRLGDLRARTLSALALAAAAAFPILYGGAPMAALAALAAGAMAWEWRRMTLAPARPVAPPVIDAAAAAVSVALAHAVSLLAAMLFLAAAAFGVAMQERIARRPMIWAPAGLVWVGLAACCFVALRDRPPFGLETALWIIGVVVACDVGAYFTGRIVGGPKLWPSVSPKKTWSGLGGGMAASASVGAFFSWATTGTYAAQVATVSAVAACVAQGGDLVESAMKRRYGVKDASALIPGHGGALDRLDGFCAASLVAAAVTFARGKPVFIW